MQTAADGIRNRRRFGVILAGIVTAAYAVIVLLIAFLPDVLARPVAAGRALTHGLLWSIAFALLSVAAMGLFVRHRTAFDRRADDGEQ